MLKLIGNIWLVYELDNSTLATREWFFFKCSVSNSSFIKYSVFSLSGMHAGRFLSFNPFNNAAISNLKKKFACSDHSFSLEEFKSRFSEEFIERNLQGSTYYKEYREVLKLDKN